MKSETSKMSRISRKVIAMLLVVAMTVSGAPIGAFAAVGDVANVPTGLSGNIDTSDTISLPIKIMDYENDGMLFEFAEASPEKSGRVAAKTAADFGATWAADYTVKTAASQVTSTEFGNFWSNVTTSLNTANTYASYLKAEYKETTANNEGAYYGRSSVIVPNDLGGIAMNNARYLVMVYRSNLKSGKIGFWVERQNLTTRTDSKNRVGDLTFTSEGDKNWTYAVYDLKQGNLNSTWESYGNATSIFTTLPMDSAGEYIDLAHVALFANEDQAEAFGEYALTDGSDRGDNRGFGLLRSSRNQDKTDAYQAVYNAVSSVKQLNTYGNSATEVDFNTVDGLGYKLLGTFGLKGIANVGLLESGLSAEGYPVYKKEVVDYMAGLLKHSLEISERTNDGWKNYRYVKGTPSAVYGGTDFATALRNKITGGLGSYDDTKKKDLVGTWAQVGGNITSYYDAAYFMLNSIFVPGSYNELQTDYNYLKLSAGIDAGTDDKAYVFDAGFVNTASPNADTPEAINYDKVNHVIQNNSAVGKAHFVYEGTSTTTLNPFLPVTDRNNANGMTKSAYYQDDGVINGVKKQTSKDTLYGKNFNFAVVSEGEFVYHADDELFFEFEGDDDVYLFINNQLVLDIGSAHSIDKVRFQLNDYVNAAKAGTLGSPERNAKLALEEGNTYSFKFYYMERHSYGSNMRVETNIRVTDPNMLTTKTAWQDGTKLDFGSIVDKDKVVEYGFGIANNGEENLYNLTFTDTDIGVTLDPTNGLKVTGSRVYDTNGDSLEASDLTAVIKHPNYSDINVTFANNAALKAFLKDLTASGTENGGGLYIGATVEIRGIGYKLTDGQVKAAVFDNTVLTTAANATGTKSLEGQATMRVFVPADPMYYEWAGHNLSVSKTKLISDILAAANSQGNALAGKVPNLTDSNVNKIELVTKAGNTVSSPYVTINSSNNLTINYPTAGSKVFYVKVTYNSSENTVIVPVLINVTDAKDSVYVLDYGLKVDLTQNGELVKNDAVTVPGRDTSNSVLAIGSNGAYTPNEITFNSSNAVNGEDGTFNYADGTVTYTPKQFMDGVDTVQVAMNVYEKGITPSKISGALNINKEVEMYKNIKVLPANVVYYEDDFPAITYNDDKDGDGIKNAFTTVQENGGSANLKQSNDQNSNYGNDAAYAENDAYSGNSLTKITIADNDTTASFNFTGTGFELIGRTNAYDSATLIVKVKDANGQTVKTVPVITEFDNNNDGGTEEIYQVPVIKVKDLPLGTYTVEISGVPARDYTTTPPTVIETVLYIDGFRIYQPLGAENENYNAVEKNAVFKEIRDQIANGYVAVCELGENLQVSTGLKTWTENYYGVDTEKSEYVANPVTSVDDYMLKGPNNEAYMMGDYTDSAVLFYVQETGTGAHGLQIGVHAVDEGLFVGADTTVMNAKLSYVTADGTWKPLAELKSGTEQYYTIDYTKCPIVDGRYQVLISINEGMASFTNLKLTGLNLTTMSEGTATTLRFENGVVAGTDAQGVNVVVDPVTVPAMYSVRSFMMTMNEPVIPGTPMDPTGPGLPIEQAEINSVKADKATYTVGDTVEVTVTTNDVAEYVTVNGNKITEFTEQESTRTWIYTAEAEKTGEMTFTAVAYNEDGMASDDADTTVTVKKYAPKTFKLTVNKTSVTVGDKVKATVTTSKDVKYVTIDGKKVTKYTYNKSKTTKTWTSEVKTSKTGTKTIKAVAYNEKNSPSKTIKKDVTVKKFAPKTFKVTLSKSSVKKGAKYTVTIKTSTDVKYVKVNDKKITKFTTKNGVKTFKVTYKATKAGKQTVKAVAYNNGGYASKSVSKTITVKNK